jgi:hypothetical protein
MRLATRAGWEKQRNDPSAGAFVEEKGRPVTSGLDQQDNRFAVVPEATARLVNIQKKDVPRSRFKEIAYKKTILVGCVEHAVGCVAQLEEFCLADLSPDNDEWFEESAIDRNAAQIVEH